MTDTDSIMQALLKAADLHADKYVGDARQDIKTDVLNAFYAGANWHAKQLAAQKWCPNPAPETPVGELIVTESSARMSLTTHHYIAPGTYPLYLGAGKYIHYVE